MPVIVQEHVVQFYEVSAAGPALPCPPACSPLEPAARRAAAGPASPRPPSSCRRPPSHRCSLPLSPQDLIPYETFSIRLSNEDLPRLREILRGVSDAQYR